MSEEEKFKLSLELLKQPKVLAAALIVAVGGVVYASEGFTIELSTCATTGVVEIKTTEPADVRWTRSATTPEPSTEPEAEAEAEAEPEGEEPAEE